MVSHKLDSVLRLEQELVDEPLLLLGILSARHKEIVADEYTLLVALVEEGELFEQTATPYTEDVGAHFTRLSYERAYLFVTLLGLEGITRYPVTATAEDLKAVYYNLEAEEIIVDCSLACDLRLGSLLGAIIVLTADLVDVIDNSDSSDTDLGAV